VNAATRASLIAAAKARATAVVSCVQARLSPHHVLDTCSRDDLVALIMILAEAADPGILRAVVTVAEDDGRPDLTRHQAKLREAHSQAVQLRKARQPIPEQIRVLDNAYRLAQKQEQAAPTGEQDAAAA
jgi:hypothetical protein